ncbi:hypothetical protein OPQ81_000967 [Rhizoctonia solani]|nr:hypothetical protein OPQ81_000967 [Rhizoctonia solani]
MSPEPSASLPSPYSGPKDDDPLTDDELTLLLAIPRAAVSTPDATLFRLPLGHDPLMGWIDATCAQVYHIVSRLAEIWKSRLLKLLSKPGDPVSDSSFGPGTTVCIATRPDFHGIFHLLAFWAIGCTVQFIPMQCPSVVVDQLNESGCKVVLYSGFDDGWVETWRKEFDGVVVQLPEEEQAHQLAKMEIQTQAGTTLPWPAPRRPTPALILQTSGTSGKPKILRMSLYYYTMELAYNCQSYLASARSNGISKTPYSHPRMAPVPFYWSSFFRYLFMHLATATPMAFVHLTNIFEFSPSQFVGWAKALDVGAIACVAGLVRQIPKATLEVHLEFFRSLFSFTFSGSSIDDNLSNLYESLKVPITNLYGTSELSRILYAPKAPYTHLRPFPDIPSPLVHPISERAPDGSRYVELWLTPAMSPRLAHQLAYGGVPMKLEPFPGNGPHNGELAVNLGDIFRELTVRNGAGSETVYIHVGRHGDQIRLGGSAFGGVNAALYEATLGSRVSACVGQSGSAAWTLDGIQLFGNNMPCTALVIQLSMDKDLVGSCEADIWNILPVQELYGLVEEANDSMRLTGCTRVHTGKRTLIMSSDGAYVHGPGSERLAGSNVSLSMTHKRTLKRWENVYKLKPWLDGLDFSEL